MQWNDLWGRIGYTQKSWPRKPNSGLILVHTDNTLEHIPGTDFPVSVWDSIDMATIDVIRPQWRVACGTCGAVSMFPSFGDPDKADGVQCVACSSMNVRPTPPFGYILITGGQIDDKGKEEIQKFLDDMRRGKHEYHKIMVLQSDGKGPHVEWIPMNGVKR